METDADVTTEQSIKRIRKSTRR